MNNYVLWVLNLNFVCNAQECNLQQCMYRTATIVAHMHDHEVEMELDAERKRRLTRVRV